MNSKKNALAVLLGSTLLTGAALTQAAETGNPFGVTELEAGYMVAEGKTKEGRCGEGSCGDKGTMKKDDGKCGEGSCGEKAGSVDKKEMTKKDDGKCGEGSCGDKS
ncbi:MAG: HvfA family oxazolone/thioamide-modified RiPP metallophore [Endozoicomonas sp.]